MSRIVDRTGFDPKPLESRSNPFAALYRTAETPAERRAVSVRIQQLASQGRLSEARQKD